MISSRVKLIILNSELGNALVGVVEIFSTILLSLVFRPLNLSIEKF